MTQNRVNNRNGSKTIQIVNTSTNSTFLVNQVIPMDDTIPQNTEGLEIITATITPTSASSTLEIYSSGWGYQTGTATLITALFQDSNADAIAASMKNANSSAFTSTMHLRHIMTSGTTSPTTFKIRCGRNGAVSFRLNGDGGGRLYGGSSIITLTIIEYL